jgi:LysM repeat protein
LKIHIVKKGDTMYEIAKKHHVTLDQLIAFNPQIEDAAKIDVGMKVKIPMNPKPVEPPPSEYAYKHIVKQGDTLWKLGKAWEIPLQAMISANPQLKNPNVLMTGEVVYIPKLDQGPSVKPTSPMTPPAAELPPVPAAPVFPPASDAPVSPVIPEAVAAPVQVPDAQSMPVTPALQEPIQMTHQMPLQNQMPLQEPTHQPNVTVDITMEHLNVNMAPPVVDMPSPKLDLPYNQAVHPFHQFPVPAAEAFAYPDKHPGHSNVPIIGMSQQPWGAGEPVGGPMQGFGVQPGYSDGGCGCGGAESNSFPIENWNTYHEAHGAPPVHPYYPIAPMPMVNPHEAINYSSYSQGMEPLYGYMQHPSMTPMGYPYPAAYEASIPPMPMIDDRESDDSMKVETSELDEQKVATDSSRSSSSSSKKAKISRASAVRAYVKKQKARGSKREKRANAPWING